MVQVILIILLGAVIEFARQAISERKIRKNRREEYLKWKEFERKYPPKEKK